MLTAKEYQDFVNPSMHFETNTTPTEQAVEQAIENGYKEEEVKKFVRSNAAGDIVAEVGAYKYPSLILEGHRWQSPF